MKGSEIIRRSSVGKHEVAKEGNGNQRKFEVAQMKDAVADAIMKN